MIEVVELRVYPVKSLHGISVPQSRLGVRGLAYDRHWMVVDSSGRFLTQRELPGMATIHASLDAATLRLTQADAELAIDLATPPDDRVEVTVWNDRCAALDEGAAASRWLTRILGERGGAPLRLVRFPADETRCVDPDYLRDESSQVAFSDGFPFLVTTEESLRLVNDRLVAKGSMPVTMDRFRPNIVIRGVAPLQENAIERIAAGAIELGLRKPCQRCKVTTIDQDAGRVPEQSEPLRTLLEMNPFADRRGAFFGQNATLLAGAGETLAVGDRMTILPA